MILKKDTNTVLQLNQKFLKLWSKKIPEYSLKEEEKKPCSLFPRNL